MCKCAESKGVCKCEKRSSIEAEIGEWYERIGEYAVAELPEDRCSIRATISEQGCVLKLRVPGEPTLDLYIERLADDVWRINVGPEEGDITAQVRIEQDGDTVLE